MKKTSSRGPLNANIMIVGEAPGETEETQGVPFVGSSGQEFERMLREAGINMDTCYITNVCKYRPPGNKIDAWFYNKTQAKREKIPEIFGAYPHEKIREGLSELWEEIDSVQPEIIIATGNTALWALQGKVLGAGVKPIGISKWRGSQLYTQDIMGKQYKMVPIIHPASILRNWSDRFWTVHDLQVRVMKEWQEPEYNFIIRPGYRTVMDQLHGILEKLENENDVAGVHNENFHLPFRLAVDLETRARHIACCGIAWSKTEAICIPFMCVEGDRNYWTEDEEIAIVLLLRKILTHKNAYIVGQNYDYDRQYEARYWGVMSRLDFDTMIAQHVLWPGASKGLDFISSLHCRHHVYWKDESKEWVNENEDQLWSYNCKDCCATYEASLSLEEDLTNHNMWEQYEFQGRILPNTVLKAVLRGINYDFQARNRMTSPVLQKMEERAAWLEKVVGFNVNSNAKTPWYNSSQQTAAFFYDVMGIKPVFKVVKGQRSRTCDDKALVTIAAREPIVRDICRTLQEYRSLGQFYRNYLQVPVDHDNRIRCQLKITGTETFRFASAADAFGYGTNLQNISSGNEEKE